MKEYHINKTQVNDEIIRTPSGFQHFLECFEEL